MKRPIVWITIFTMCGIYMRLGISELICLVFFLFIIISISRIVIKSGSVKYAGLLLFVLLGFLSAEQSICRKTAEESLVGIVYGQGIVGNTGITSSRNQKLEIKGDLYDMDGHSLQDVKLYAIWTGENHFTVGEKISFSGELIPFSDASVPGGYDENLYLRTRGYDGKIYPDSITYLGEDHSISSELARIRAKVHLTLDQILPAEESGIMKAMLTGDREDIPDEAYQMYTHAGVVHILCISGLHMSLLALYVSFFTEKVLKQSRRVSAAVTILTSVCFLIFTGFTPSAVRAVTMICVVMTGRILFRAHDRLNEIALAALLILLKEPLYLFHIGFQLSFITVLGLCIAAEQMNQKKGKDRTLLDWLKDSLRFSLYASLFSYPLVAYHFYSVSLVGILANLVILPLSGILLGAGILSAVSGMICQPIGVFAAGSVYVILQIFEVTCELLLKLPYSYILTGRPLELVILLYYCLLLFWMKAGERQGSWKAAVLLCMLLWCAVFENQLFRKETTIAFLDVGQGDAAVITTYDGKTYLIDGGGAYGKAFGRNVGKTVLHPYLQYLGKNSVDAAFLSHPDADHMTGLLEVMEEMPIKTLYLSDYPYIVTENVNFLKETLEKYPIKLYTVDNKSIVSSENWEFHYPIQGIAFEDGDDNHGSMVLKYCCNGTKVLFTGDIAAEDEMLLLESGADVSADILKVSHHGSKYSSSVDFLKKVDAETAIISCGENNIYGHPHQETVERLEDAGTEIFRTDRDGTIFLKLKRDGVFEIETMTERKPFYERVKETMEKW